MMFSKARSLAMVARNAQGINKQAVRSLATAKSFVSEVTYVRMYVIIAYERN